MKITQVVVIGLGRFGTTVATTLYQMGHDVLAIDKDPVKVQELAGQVTYCLLYTSPSPRDRTRCRMPSSA